MSKKTFSSILFVVLAVFLIFGFSESALAAKGVIKTPNSGGMPGSITISDLGITDVGTLPSSKWYFLKEWRRGLERFFTFNSIKRAELELRITNENAAEALTVQETKLDDAKALAIALENYTNAGERLRTQLAKLKETSENPNVEKLLEKLNEQTLKHAALFNQFIKIRDTDSPPDDGNILNPQATRDNHLQGAVDVVQKKIQGLVIIAAEKDKNIEQKAVDQIARAETVIKELESELAEFAINEPGVPNEKTGPIRLDPTPKRDFGDRMKAGLDQSGGILANAKALFAKGKFGEAFGQARTAEVFARNELRVLSGVLRADPDGLENGMKNIAPNADAGRKDERKGVDADMPRIEDTNSAMPIVPDTGKAVEKIVPEAKKRVFPETNNKVFPETNNPQALNEVNGRTACDNGQASACPRGEILECKNGNWICVGPATGGGLIAPKESPSSSADVSGYNFVFSGGVFDMTNAPAMSNGTSLSGVTVSVTGPLAFSTQTQSNGTFVLTFRNAPIGNYRVCVTLPSGLTAPSAGDPPCEEVAVELIADERMLVFTNKGNKAYYTGTGFNFYAIRK